MKHNFHLSHLMEIRVKYGEDSIALTLPDGKKVSIGRDDDPWNAVDKLISALHIKLIDEESEE
jgi:hypothetical protein